MFNPKIKTTYIRQLSTAYLFEKPSLRYTWEKTCGGMDVIGLFSPLMSFIGRD